MNSRFIQAGILIGVSAFFYSCDRIPGPRNGPSGIDTPASFLPGRGEVASSGGFRISMNAYEVLRETFPTLKPADTIRLGLYSLWLKEKVLAGKTASLEDASRSVRLLFSPSLTESEQSETLRKMNLIWGLSSITELKNAINDAWLGKKVELNPALAQEYGIPTVDLGINSG